MTVTHDHRERVLVTCDGCGVYTHRWRRVCLSADGEVVFDVQLCRRCETDTRGAVKLVWEALATK